ncbi:MAG TPA: outer membrane lipoprotein chaperone LolA [Steroidobacteraceae bacterium]|nr:outer membrane lipoprotein chaperone LolA [Steroidobacteraceae bacterium]
MGLNSVRRAACGLVLGVLLATGRAAADGPADAAALATVEHALAALDSVRAEFVQQLVGRDGSPGERAVGTLYLKKPGRFRWDYTEPRQLIVSDGEWLWLYDPELEQATVRKVRDTLSQTPAMLLSGEARVSAGYLVTAAGHSDGLDWVQLVPRQADSDFKQLRLGFAGEVLKRMEFADKLNGLTRVELTKVERNARLPESLFHFVAPPGVDVIGPAGR